MTDRKLMQQALEALNRINRDSVSREHAQLMSEEAITALRQAIEQAEQTQPVAWMVQYKDRHEFVWSEPKFLGDKAFVVPLYTIPPKREWVGMTDEEIENMMDYWSDDARSAYGGAHAANGEYVYIPDIIRYAESRLKEKNT